MRDKLVCEKRVLEFGEGVIKILIKFCSQKYFFVLTPLTFAGLKKEKKKKNFLVTISDKDLY